VACSAVGSQGNSCYPADSEMMKRRREALVDDILRPVMSELTKQRQLINDTLEHVRLVRHDCSKLSATIASLHADMMSVVGGTQDTRSQCGLPLSPCSLLGVPTIERVGQRSISSGVTQSQQIMMGFDKRPGDQRVAAINDKSRSRCQIT